MKLALFHIGHGVLNGVTANANFVLDRSIHLNFAQKIRGRWLTEK
jgi:hypothetical protein